MRTATLFVLAALQCLMGCNGELSGNHRPIRGAERITVYGTTDTAIFTPLIADFTSIYPTINVDYVDLDATPLYNRFLKETEEKRPTADLLISSAMDLQVKLVNDGLAARHVSSSAQMIPAWAKWRNEAFGLTFEPVVMVYNIDLLRGRQVPHTRLQLLDALQSDQSFWNKRIGTYDINVSSVGYLLASQDARQSSEFAPLSSAFGAVQVRTYQTTSLLLDALEKGEIALGYNLLGSYARQRVQKGARLGIANPQDYTLAIIRTAFIPKNAPHAAAAHQFLEYLLSPRGQRILSERSGLDAVRQEITNQSDIRAIANAGVGPLRPIKLGPGLLVYLDRQKREQLLDNWNRLTQSQAEGASLPDSE